MGVVELPPELVKAVAHREVILVVGTGASIAAVGDPDSPVSWRGLLQDGLTYTKEQNLLSPEMAENGVALLRDGYFDAAASVINEALQGRRSDWLMSAFNGLKMKEEKSRLYDAIAGIHAASLITTNYDILLGSYLARTPISWLTGGFATALNMPEALSTAVLHIHGCYLEPNSVVLDAADYERLSRSPAMEALQAAAANRPLLFVGCGPEGLQDPHFRRLWKWLEEVTTRQHYALLPKSIDPKRMRSVSGPQLRFVLYEGDDEDSHAALPLALEQLAEEASVETDQLQDVGRVAVQALDKIVDEIRTVVLNIQGFDELLPEGVPPTEALEENRRKRLHKLVAQESRGADLCVISTPVALKDVEDICNASDTHTLMILAEGGILLGSPEGDREVIDDSAVDVDFSDGPPKAWSPTGSGQPKALRVTSAKNRIGSGRATLLIGDEAPSLIAAPGSWSEDVESGKRGKRLNEVVAPAETDTVLMFDLAVTEEKSIIIHRAEVREVVYGLSQERFPGLRRMIEGQAPLSVDAKDELLKMLAPLDASAFALLRKDLATADVESDGEWRLHHIAAQVELRNAPEAVYEALIQDDETSQEDLHSLLPRVRRLFRRPVDDGASLTTQAGDQQRLLLAASLGDFNLKQARTSFSRQRTLLGVVAEQKLRLMYTLRSRQAASNPNSPPEREFLIHCFAGDDDSSGLVTRQSVAAAVQSTFHDAYPISYSSAIQEDLEDVQIAAGKAEGYARRWIVPSAPSASWPVSDHGFIADYIRTLPGDIAVTWECHGDWRDVELPAPDAPGPHSLGGDDNPFDELKRLAFDPAYGSGGVGLRCCISVRGVDGADGEVASEVAGLVGNEVFGASAFRVLADDGDEYASVSVGHALLAMHAPFGRLYATSFDTPRRFTRPLKNQSFSSGVAIGTGQRKGVERDFPEKITLSDEERFHHVHVVGRPGVGKTTLLKRMILGDLEAGAGVTVVDPHGGLADWTVAHIPSHRLKDVVLVDLDVPSHAPALNLLDSDAVGSEDYDRVVSEVIHFMRERSYHEWSGPVFEQLVRLGFLSMRDPSYPVAPALTDLVLLLANDRVRKALEARVEDEELQDGWRLQGRQDVKHYAEVLQWVTSKFDELTKDPALRATLGAPHSTLDIGEAVREGKILIFRLTATRISEQAADFIGSMLLTALQQELLDLSTSRNRPSHFVYIDEFHRFATLGLERLVVEARKFRVGMTLAHQNLDQLSAFHGHTGRVLDQIPSTLVGNAGTLVVFPVSSYDRERLARELGCTTEEIGELARFQALARIAVGSGSIQPFTVEIEDMGEPDATERMAELRRMMRERGIWVPIAQVIETVSERHREIRRWARSTAPKVGTSPSAPAKDPPSSAEGATTSFVDDWLKKRKEHLESGASGGGSSKPG